MEVSIFFLVVSPCWLFLGIPVGGNPRRKAKWNPILDKFQRKLSMWMSRKVLI